MSAGADPARERGLRELLESVLDLPPEERRAALGGADPALAREVEELLDSEERLGDFLERPAIAALGVEPPAPPPTAPGWHAGPPDALEPGAGDREPPAGVIGPYRLLGKIGEGGMGTVWLAEQTEPVERRVAIKLVRASLAGAAARRRFEAERRALARLEHPNVARLYEAATTAGGHPYFVMELVDGPPITVYCDRRRLPVERRLELFVAACRGVEHAHRRQLLHRDLKPNNLLVAETDGGPVPKVIDFGIAKALDAPLADATVLTGDRILGTPQYMSPEALNPAADGLDLDTRSDVYSLGVVLYELLTGVRPYAAESGRLPSLLRAIAEDDPPRPSARVEGLEPDTRSEVAAARLRDPEALSGGLAGDLDWIVMKALAKDPARRYGSAAELADDVERSLRHEPVLARPPSLGYRTRRLVRRHRLAAALGALATAALVSTAAATSVALVRERRAEERARAEAAASRQALDFLVDLFEAASPEASRGEAVTARELLERGAERIRGQDLPPLSRARLLHTLADVHVRLGLYEPARALAAEALAIRETELPDDHPEVIASLDLLGNLERRAGRLDQAAPLVERVIAIHDRRAAPDPLALADALNSLGNLRWRQQRWDEAERLHLRALGLRREALGPEATEVGDSHNNLGALYWSQDRFDEAESHLSTAAELFERNLGPDHPRVAAALNNLGILAQLRGRYAENEALQRRVLAIRERVQGPDHPETAATLGNLAIVVSKTGDPEEAERLYRRALEVRRATLGEEHVETVKTLANLGLHTWRHGRLEEAEEIFREVVAIRERRFGPDHPDTAHSRVQLALALRDQGRTAAARPLLEDALAIQRAALGEDHREVASTLHHLGVLALREGRDAEAEERLRAALAIREPAAGAPPPPALADTLHELAGLYRRTGRRAEAERAYRRALELRRRHLPADHRDVRRTEAELAALDGPV